jgi:DNA-binding Lrp family transcriptional regulator
MAAMAAAVKERFRSADVSMLLNPAAGAIRPPGSRHRLGGRSFWLSPPDRVAAAFAFPASRAVWSRIAAACDVPAALVSASPWKLSPALYDMLTTGAGLGRYSSRSEAVAALSVSAFSRAGEDGLRWLDRQLRDGRNVLAYSLAVQPRPSGGVRDVGRLISASAAAARRFVAASPPLNPANARSAVDRVVDALSSQTWPGRRQQSELAVLVALCRFADAAGGPVVDASQRRLALEVAMSRETVAAALDRLLAAGWVALVRAGSGRQASTWRVKVPVSLRAVQLTVATPPEDGGGSHASAEPSSATPSSPVSVLRRSVVPPVRWQQVAAPWASSAFCGRTAGVVVDVLAAAGPLPAATIAERCGLPVRSVRRSVARLVKAGAPVSATVVDGVCVWELDELPAGSLSGAPVVVSAPTSDQSDGLQNTTEKPVSVSRWMAFCDETGVWWWLAARRRLFAAERLVWWRYLEYLRPVAVA